MNYEIIIKNIKKKFILEDKLINLIKEEKINKDYINYYFLSKYNNKKNNKKHYFENFANEINSELIGNFLNIFVRCTKPIIKNYNCLLAEKILDNNLFIEYLYFKNVFEKMRENNEYSKINKFIMKLAKKINFYINNEKPWHLHKNDISKKRAHYVYTISINLFLILLIGMKPFIPRIIYEIKNILYLEDLSWNTFEKPLLKIEIKKYSYIAKKINFKIS